MFPFSFLKNLNYGATLSEISLNVLNRIKWFEDMYVEQKKSYL
jgi:hypothetical protein